MFSQGSQDHDDGSHNQDFDDAEKGQYDNTQSLAELPPPITRNKRSSALVYIESLWSPPLWSPTSPVHKGITPSSSVPILSLPWSAGFKPHKEPGPTAKPAKPKQKISRWILFTIWFNTYRKFFTFVTLLNLAGIIMASLNRFPYAENHLGALVLGNLLCAILMRNELFLRFLYIIAIHGLRSASPFLCD
jgi:hypothetical protein